MSGHLVLRWVAVASLAAAGAGLAAAPRLGAHLLGDSVQFEVINGGPGGASNVTVSVDGASVRAASLGHEKGAGPRLRLRTRADLVTATVRWSTEGRDEQWSRVLHVSEAARIDLILRPGGTVEVVRRGRRG
jgi:hypothetical protein